MAVHTHSADPEALAHGAPPAGAAAPGDYDGAKVGRIFAVIFGVAVCLIAVIIFALSQ